MSDDNQNEENVSDETQKPEANTTPEVQADDKPKRGGRKPKTPTPGIGRIVHYVTGSGTIRPAIIAGLNEETVDVSVFNTKGAQFIENVPFDAEFPGETPGTVFWPEIN